jgi:hypothetical protein
MVRGGDDDRHEGGDEQRRPCAWCGFRRALLVVDGVPTCALCQSANPTTETTRAAAQTFLDGFWEDE